MRKLSLWMQMSLDGFAEGPGGAFDWPIVDQELHRYFIDELGTIARAEKCSRAEVIRKAIASYIEQNKPVTEDAFGIWESRQVDGLDYQENLRSEW